MDKTRVVCFAKALFPPKFNFKVVNSMNNGGQPDLDFHVCRFTKSTCYCLKIPNQVNELIKKTKPNPFSGLLIGQNPKRPNEMLC